MDGGAEKVLINTVNNLNPKKFDITIQTLFDYGINKKYLNKNIKYKYVFKKVFRGNIHILKIFSPQFLFKKMITEKYDIIISYLEGPTTRIVSGCIDSNTKLINWVHTELKDLKEFVSSYRSIKEMKESYIKYDKTIFVSVEAETAFKKVVDIDSCVVKNIIDTEEIKVLSKEKVIDEMTEDKRIKLITLGRLIKVKGYERLLKVHKQMINEGIEHSLYILGEGEERNKLEDYIRKNNLSDSVKLYGFKENPYKYLREADIYVCSSYKEGYNTAIIEAITVGKPVVTTDCSGMREILKNGKYGLIVPNNENELVEALRKFIKNKELRREYESLALERSKDFDIKVQLEHLEDLLGS